MCGPGAAVAVAAVCFQHEAGARQSESCAQTQTRPSQNSSSPPHPIKGTAIPLTTLGYTGICSGRDETQPLTALVCVGACETDVFF